MTDYLNFNDLKAAIISILVFFICLGLQRYWSNHTIKSLNRRIKETEARKVLVEDLAKSEKSILIFGFQGVFAVLFLIALAGAAMQLGFFLTSTSTNPWDAVLGFLWTTATIISLGTALLFKKVGEYPRSLETFEKKIEQLKSRLRGHPKE